MSTPLGRTKEGNGKAHQTRDHIATILPTGRVLGLEGSAEQECMPLTDNDNWPETVLVHSVDHPVRRRLLISYESKHMQGEFHENTGESSIIHAS